MNELNFTMATTLFLLGWYGVILIVRRALAPLENIRLVWCPDIFAFSWVEITVKRQRRAISAVRNCLLWPEQQGCEQHCIK